ncbi:MAG TPA: hypothetical protein VJB99_02375 [Patescibacteria group bacterium]|nr:hypothetical protein [Patescibacteria group bacterium]
MNDASRPARQLNDVTDLNITCTQCGAKIDKLPFVPTVKQDGTYGMIYCYPCNKSRNARP